MGAADVFWMANGDDAGRLMIRLPDSGAIVLIAPAGT
jgi:hypothetical protein